jgi:hypothetical protein
LKSGENFLLEDVGEKSRGSMKRTITSTSQSSWAAAQPTVYEKVVEITVIDSEGKRHVIPGLEGQTVAQLLEQHTDILGPHAVAGSPEGRGCMDAHVKIPNEMLDVIPPPTGDDKAVIEELADPASLDKHSRLGSRIILSKSLQGAVLSIGDIYPWKTL